MKPKYSLKLIQDYILSNDIEDYNIDDLENDPAFMLEIIKYTKDKNFYYLCSDNAKLNYEIVKYLIITFKSDTEFICTVADKFLEESEEQIHMTELYIIMSKLTEKTEHNLFYKLKSELIYEKEKMIIEAIKQDNEIPKTLIENIGNGFFIIYDNYLNSKIILDFFSSKMIDELLLNNEEFNLEKYLHQNHNSFQEIEKIGINNFILTLIAHYDMSLASYLTLNLHLLNDIRNKMYKIKNKWARFDQKNKDNKVDYLVEKIGKYIYDVYDCSLIETDIILSIAEEMGFLDTLLSHPYFCEYLNAPFQRLDKKNLSFADLRHYLNIKKMFAEVMSQKIFEEPDPYIETEPTPGKIIQIDFQNRKRKI